MSTTNDSNATRRLRRRIATGALLAATLVAAGCGDSQDANPEASVATTDGLGTDGGVTSAEPIGPTAGP